MVVSLLKKKELTGMNLKQLTREDIYIYKIKKEVFISIPVVEHWLIYKSFEHCLYSIFWNED